MIKKIVTVPHAVLNKTAAPVKTFDSHLSDIVENMKETLLAQHDPMGVGLSGNQIDVLKRIFIVRHDEEADITVFINPKVTNVVQGSSDRKPTLEGCLSIPEVWGHVLRPEKVTVEYQDVKGDTHSGTFEGFEGVVVQHEIDHLNGILFTQHTLAQGYQLYKEEEGELEPYAL